MRCRAATQPRPASPIFHYAQEIFEEKNADWRMGGRFIPPERQRAPDESSADRLCMPPLDENVQVDAIARLVDLDRDWVPGSEGTSLYIRPTMISDGCSLGANSANRFIYFVICAPTGSYYAEGMKPIRIRIEQRYVRAVKGGMGRAKTGGNYAASFKATKEAMDDGFSQVLWLDGREQKYVEEVGAMNMMFVVDNKILTAELGDTILPGVTRDSVITLAREHGIEVEERRISVSELYQAHAEGRLTEAFGTGTAAVISPVGELQYMGESIIINNKEIGPMSQFFYDTLTSLQRQKAEDTHGWTAVIPHFTKE